MLALERVKRRVRPEHFQIFDLFVVQGWPASKVAEALEVSIPLVYVTRHRISSLLKKEVKVLQSGKP
jgi:FixJ family two-component response regulator